MYAFSLALQWYVSTWEGFVWVHGVALYATGVTVAIAVFYIAIRSGYSRRFVDPALTVAQMVFAIIAITCAYLINPPARGMLLMLIALVLVALYAGCRRLRFGLARWRCNPVARRNAFPAIEALHFLFSGVFSNIASWLASSAACGSTCVRKRSSCAKRWSGFACWPPGTS